MSAVTTQNHGETVVPQPHGGALRPFAPGNRANPGGRPKGLEKLVSARTNGGADLVNFMADIFHRSGQFESANIPLPTRMEAGSWLADRLWGKPKQIQEHQGKDGGAIALEGTLRGAIEVRAVDYRLAVKPLLTGVQVLGGEGTD